MKSIKGNCELNLHRIMCVIGGFMGAYALLNCCDNFGSAQTSNMIYLVMNLLGGNFTGFLMRLGGLVAYFAAIELYVYMDTKTTISPKQYALITESICIILIGFIPKDIDFIFFLYPVFFMMSTQWCVFHGAAGFNSSTIFSTNNFKQFSLALAHYIAEKDHMALAKMNLFANSLIFFHVGVVISFFACRIFHFYASWFVILPLATAFLIVKIQQRASERSADVITAPVMKQVS